MSSKVVTKKIVKENDIAYTDKIFIEPLSISDLVDAEIATPEATEELEYEDDCGIQGDADSSIGIRSGNGIDLFVDEYPRLPEGYSKYPDSYKITLPEGVSKNDAASVAAAASGSNAGTTSGDGAIDGD